MNKKVNIEDLVERLATLNVSEMAEELSSAFNFNQKDPDGWQISDKGSSKYYQPTLDFVNRYLKNGDEWDSKRKFHITNKKIESFEKVTQRENSVKPVGIWYGINDAWMEWCAGEQQNWFCPYIYEIKTKKSKILTIENVAQFERFEDKYTMSCLSGIQGFPAIRNPTNLRLFDGQIDWIKLSSEFSGLEIPNYLWEKRLNSMWYYGWDCASGCVWDEDGIKEISLIAYYDEESNEFFPTLGT